jgi:hypothetical protein
MITPADVRSYTVFDAVKARTDALLNYDIIQAAQDVYQYCGHKFDDAVLYPTLPEEVNLALIKLTEYYALTNMDESRMKGYKSEKIGDYSYTADGSSTTISLSSLLASHVQTTGQRSSTKVRLKSI